VSFLRVFLDEILDLLPLPSRYLTAGFISVCQPFQLSLGEAVSSGDFVGSRSGALYGIDFGVFSPLVVDDIASSLHQII